MKILTKDTWQIIRQNWKNILLFELLYRGITTPVYMRLVSRGIRLALRAAGYSYLTPANIGTFLIQPVTLLALSCHWRQPDWLRHFRGQPIIRS